MEGFAGGKEDIVVHAETIVRGGAGQGYDALFAEGKDIIADNIFLAVMLVEGLALGVMADIIFNQDIRGALIGIDGPSTVVAAANIINMVSAQFGAGLFSQGVNSTHIGKQALADIVQFVIFHQVMMRGAGSISPDPTYRDGRIIQVVDVIVGIGIVGRVHGKNADGGVKDRTEVMQMTIGDGDMVSMRSGGIFGGSTVDTDSSAA